MKVTLEFAQDNGLVPYAHEYALRHSDYFTSPDEFERIYEVRQKEILKQFNVDEDGMVEIGDWKP